MNLLDCYNLLFDLISSSRFIELQMDSTVGFRRRARVAGRKGQRLAAAIAIPQKS